MDDNPNYTETFDKSGLSLSPEQVAESVEMKEGELHLCFTIPSGDEFALPAVGIKEVMQQDPQKITPIPNSSPLLLGTINLRGEIIWVADLGQFLGYPNLLNTERPEIPVIAVEEQDMILGLAIDKLGAMQWLSIDDLQIPQNIPDHVSSYVQGEWMENNHRFVRILDQIAILRSARWMA